MRAHGGAGGRKGQVGLTRALAHAQVYVTDPDLNLVPVGELGEIYVGGVTLARGYVNRPELTTQRFVPSPFSDTFALTGPDSKEYADLYLNRMYRTGDVGRFLEDGTVEIVGRCDFMVKIRGYSVNVGAVESALLSSPYVKSAAVVAEGAEGTDKRLVAYVVVAEGDEGDSEESEVEEEEGGGVEEVSDAELVAHMSAHLRELLPFYAVPAHYVKLRALPIFVSGRGCGRGCGGVGVWVCWRARPRRLTHVSRRLFRRRAAS